MSQRSVSGNSKIGCNAVIIAGLRHRKISLDAYDMLEYCATTKEGGGSLLTSYMKCLPVRVFRSSTYNSIYRANNKTTCCCSRCRANGFATPHPQSPKKTVYRYDGLYKIVKFTMPCSMSSTSTTPIVFNLIKLWDA